MENLKPFLKTLTKTDTATTVAASVMFSVCTLAMFLTFGMLAVAAVNSLPRTINLESIYSGVPSKNEVR